MPFVNRTNAGGIVAWIYTNRAVTQVGFNHSAAGGGCVWSNPDTGTPHDPSLASRQVFVEAPAGPTTHFGASSLTFTFGFVTANKRTTFTNSTQGLVFNFVTANRRKTFGVSAATITLGFVTANRRKTFGVSSQTITFGIVAAPRLTVRAATSLPVVFGFSTNAIIAGGVVTHYGASSQTITFGLVTANRRKTFGASAVTLAFGLVTAPRLRARTSSSATLTFGIATAPRLRARASTSLPIVFGLTSSSSVAGEQFPGTVTMAAASAPGVTVTAGTGGTVTDYGAGLYGYGPYGGTAVIGGSVAASNGTPAGVTISTGSMGRVSVEALTGASVTITREED